MTLLEDPRDSHASDIGHWLRMTLRFWVYARCVRIRAYELIATQIKLENTSKSLKEAQDEINENSKSIIRMETELKEYRKEDNKAANH